MAAWWKSGDLQHSEGLSLPAWGGGLRPVWLALGLLAWLTVSDLINTWFFPQSSLQGLHLLIIIAAWLGAFALGSLARRGPRFLLSGAAALRRSRGQAQGDKTSAEERLRDCEERYRRLVELSPDGIVLHQDRRIVFLNLAAVRLFGGGASEDLLGQDILEFVAPEFRELVIRRMRQVLEEEGSAPLVEIRLRRLDGQLVDVEAAAVRLPYQGRPAVLAIVRDITERRRVEQELRESEARFRQLFEQVADALFLHDQGRILEVNRQACDSLGYSREELLSMNIADIEVLSPEDLAGLWQQEVVTPVTILSSHRRKDGSTFPVEVRVQTIRLGGGRPRLALARDITERQKAEAALKESEARFRAVFENAPIGIGLMELEGPGLEVNPAFIRMLGHSQAEICRMTTEDLLHPDDVAERRRLIQEIREGRRETYERQGRFIRPDGSHLWARIFVSLVPGTGERRPLLLAMLEDITRQKETAAALEAYQERLRSLAAELSLTEERERRLLAADLHDHVGQPLALAKIKMAALRETLAWEGRRAEVQEPLRYLEEAIAASRSLTSKLSPPMLFEGGLEDAVEWLAGQVQQRHHLSVTVRRGNHRLALPEADRILLFRTVQEALTNVVKHARARNVQISLDKKGSNLCIEIKDDGIGFNVDAVTGKSGQFTGFGLFSIRERLGHMGASLEVASKPGEGATVRILAPLKNGWLSREGNHEN